MGSFGKRFGKRFNIKQVVKPLAGYPRAIIRSGFLSISMNVKRVPVLSSVLFIIRNIPTTLLANIVSLSPLAVTIHTIRFNIQTSILKIGSAKSIKPSIKRMKITKTIK